MDRPLGISRCTEDFERRRLPRRGEHTEAARLARLDHLRRLTGVPLLRLERTTLDATRLCSNVEALIGGVEVPVGVAGPLQLAGAAAQGSFFLPLATTEGALVSSASRGALALTESGGVEARVLGRQMTRAPLFTFGSFGAAGGFCAWLQGHLGELQERTRDVSRHARLVAVQPLMLGINVVVRFVFETGDAAGQNMSTACAWHLCRFIDRQLRHDPSIAPEAFYVESNASLDKKVGFASWLGGRGLRVIASAAVADPVCRRVLKVSAEQLLFAYHRSMEAAVQVGMIGHNVNVANVVAGAFIATGQDVACVHESSLAQLTMQAAPGGVQVSMTLPSLIVGTVGGGTHLPAQQELLELVGCAGSGGVDRLAEIIAGFSLALDLSTLAAVAGGQFAAAHERMGRNRPVRPFGEADLVPQLFQPGLRRVLADEALEVTAVAPVEDVDLGGSLLSDMTRPTAGRLVGQLPRRLQYSSLRSGPGHRDVLVRIKPLDQEVLLMTHLVASMCGTRLGELHRRFARHSSIAGCHLRELGVYQQADPRFTRHAPALYQVLRDDARELYVLVLELLRDVELKDSADDLRGWTLPHVEAAVRGIAEVHSIWYGREAALRQEPWLGEVVDSGARASMVELWSEALDHAAGEFPDWYGLPERHLHQRLVSSLPDGCRELEQMPRTLIHGDFNPRNLAFRRDPSGLRLCAWDWELAEIQVPQRDLAELLAFVLPADVAPSTVDGLIELHRHELSRHAGATIDAAKWRRGYHLALRDFLVTRLSLYQLVHAFRPCAFLERVLTSARHLLRIEEGEECTRPALRPVALRRAGGAP
ncbi:MAG TPA: phosphotransferase [Myxococcaceae bacterium]|nr:phosphotransferase [Myxococcaceae bacterium]